MSGGSYNYLCFADTAGDVLNHSEFHNMLERLRGLPYAKSAVREMESILELKAKLEQKCRLLNDVWHDVEWWDSADSGEAEVKESCRKLDEQLNP
jgi:hypothetical protein